MRNEGGSGVYARLAVEPGPAGSRVQPEGCFRASHFYWPVGTPARAPMQPCVLLYSSFREVPHQPGHYRMISARISYIHFVVLDVASYSGSQACILIMVTAAFVWSREQRIRPASDWDVHYHRTKGKTISLVDCRVSSGRAFRPGGRPLH